MKNASLLNSEELGRKTIEAKKEKLVEEKKEYQRNQKQLQAQLESAQEHRKSLDPASVKKRLEDYEQMLQYYILMRTNNKMKDFEAKFEEWWEVVEEYFAKELESNLVHRRIDEVILKYKLEIYQKNLLDFVYGSPISTEASGQYEETKGGPSKTTQEEEVQTKEPHDLGSRTTQEGEAQIKKP